MEKDLTVGNPLNLIIALSIPQVLSAILQLLYNTVDALIVGRYVGEAALAGVGISTSIVFLLSSVMLGISAGVSIIVGQYYGAKEYMKIRQTIGSSVVALTAITVAISIVGVLGTDLILKAINTPAEAFQYTSDYLKIYIAGTIFTLLFNLYSGVLRAVGDAKSPLLFLGIAAGLNVILDLVFIIVFKMGTAGAALATIISQGFSSLFCLIYIRKKLPILALARDEYKYDGEKFGLVLKYGIPSAVQISVISLGNMALQNLINGYGVSSVAGYSSAIRIDSFIIMPYMNVGIVLSNFAGQNVGARLFERVKEGLKSAYKLLAGISIVGLPIVWFFAEKLVGVFLEGSSTDAVYIGALMLRDLVPFYIFLGLLNNTSGLLRGAGDNIFSLYGSFVSIGVRIIFAYLLNSWLGIRSVWIASAIGWIVAFLFVYARFLSGKWKEKGVNRSV